ncbi:MAG TPA: DUF4388 domain-containing protein [Pyrinomonadaceae bacterium]|nr:DUF4388 domain-containing protein [Pyrinomonadaceae bacterium]
MSLTGQLNDLSLGELIEFFCNQRKTGRLKVDYALAPGVFFMDAGELVDAKVGALNGAEAVYFALTLPSASFDFTAGVRSSRRTINERWPSVVLEGLRRIDEGLPAASADAFHGDLSLDGATLEYLDCVADAKPQPAGEEQAPSASVAGEIDAAFEQAASSAPPDRPAPSNQDAPSAQAAPAEQTPPAAQTESSERAAPFSLTVEAAATSGGGRRNAALAAVAAVLVVCAVAAVPISRRFSAKNAPPPAAESKAADAETAPTPAPADALPPAAEDANAVTPTPDFAAEEAARREREAREREARERARRQREEAARRAEENAGEKATTPAPKPSAAGPKTVRVQITYDEAGRVTQAAAVGTSPGAEAYASTAVRVARGRRFPAGKAGTTVVTIPIN